jgi:hypothetical protein
MKKRAFLFYKISMMLLNQFQYNNGSWRAATNFSDMPTLELNLHAAFNLGKTSLGPLAAADSQY